MFKKPSAARVALFANRLNLTLVLLFIPALSFLMEWYCTVQPLARRAYWAVIIAFYCCAVFVLLALWTLDKVLRNIRSGEVFVSENVRWVRRVQHCCGFVSLICIPAACFYMPLWFMVVIMAFLFLLIWVLTQALEAAVAIREENDLTI